MKKFLISFPLLLCLIVVPACKEKNGITIVGLDGEGKEVELNVDKKLYSLTMKKAVRHLDEETVKSLETLENSPWEVEKVEAGLAVGATVGLGPIIKLGVTPGFRLMYKKAN